jgi:hypothetical protein
VKPFRRPPPEAEHPAYARYRAMLDRLDGLQKEADEVRHRVRARRKSIS